MFLLSLFVTFLGTLKKLVRRPQNPVQLIVRRYEELQVGDSPLNELGVGLVTSFVKSKRKITWEANHFDHSTFHTISKISGG